MKCEIINAFLIENADLVNSYERMFMRDKATRDGWAASHHSVILQERTILAQPDITFFAWLSWWNSRKVKRIMMSGGREKYENAEK